MKNTGIYIHIPFCVRKCAYCDFFSFSADEELKRHYADAVIKELEAWADHFQEDEIDTVYIGGGTPTVMDPADLVRILSAVRNLFLLKDDAEITMEMNPGTVTRETAFLLRPLVNRVSLGIQSFHDSELKALGRIHSAAEAVEAVGILRRAGFENLSFDLMYGIPGQTVPGWKETLEKAVALSPRHISAYSLIIEEGTPFEKMYRDGKLTFLPSEDEEREMTDLAEEYLSIHGFSQYEISNYALPGYESRHNTRYWKRSGYLGIGAGASSLIGHTRWRNTRDIGLYLTNSSSPELLKREEERLDLKAEMEEFMFLGLRMKEGVTEQDFREMFGRNLTDVYGDQIRKQLDGGFLRTDGCGRFAFTGRGMEVSNVLLAEYL